MIFVRFVDWTLVVFVSLNWELTNTFPRAYYLQLLQFIFNIYISDNVMAKFFKTLYIYCTI
jgi:hypothetical protein